MTSTVAVFALVSTKNTASQAWLPVKEYALDRAIICIWSCQLSEPNKRRKIEKRRVRIDETEDRVSDDLNENIVSTLVISRLRSQAMQTAFFQTHIG